MTLSLENRIFWKGVHGAAPNRIVGYIIRLQLAVILRGCMSGGPNWRFIDTIILVLLIVITVARKD